MAEVLSKRISRRETMIRMESTVKALMRKELVLPLLDLVITTRCTLKCKKCIHLIPYYSMEGRSSFDLPLESIQYDLDQLLSSVDHIVKVNVLGGEPFIYSNLKELLEILPKYNKVGQFVIISNGTVIPDDTICGLLHNSKFYVHLNDYKNPNQKIDRIMEKFHQFEIAYGVSRNQQWYDFGNLEKQNLPQEMLEENFNKCELSMCKALMLGELHTCAFQKHGVKIGLIPKADVLKIHEYTSSELRQQIIEFYRKERFTACDYCRVPNRNAARLIPAGEQIIDV